MIGWSACGSWVHMLIIVSDISDVDAVVSNVFAGEQDDGH